MDNVVFKQSVMGFNRTQVLEYIDTLVKQLKEQETEYTNKQLALQDEIDRLSSKCAENKQDLTLTVDKIKELSVELEYFKKNNEELKNQIDYYKNLTAKLLNLKRTHSVSKPAVNCLQQKMTTGKNARIKSANVLSKLK